MSKRYPLTQKEIATRMECSCRCDCGSNQTLQLILSKSCIHRFLGIKSQYVLLMVEITLTVSKWQPFKIFKEQNILNRLIIF